MTLGSHGEYVLSFLLCPRLNLPNVFRLSLLVREVIVFACTGRHKGCKLPSYKVMLSSFSSCRYDYLRIANDKNLAIGTFCGTRSGLSFLLMGNYAVISFHSDGSYQGIGYHLLFSHFAGNYNEYYP